MKDRRSRQIENNKKKYSNKNKLDEEETSDEETRIDVREYAKKLGLNTFSLDTEDLHNDSKESATTNEHKIMKNNTQTEDKCTETNKTAMKKVKKKNKYKIQDDKITSTVPDNKLNDLLDEKLQETQLIKSGIKWFEHNLYSQTEKKIVEESTLMNAEALKCFAQLLLSRDVELYRRGKAIRSDYGWVQTVLKNGTIADKVSAHTLLIQDSAIHNLSSIDSLVKMVNMKGKRECLMAADTLRDLFLSDLLLEDKKLKKFEQHPLSSLDKITSGNQEAKRRLLILWYFEDQLKNHYNTFVRALETITHDSVEKLQHKAVVTISDLLINNPEQEQYLLETLVNKLGHPARSVAARVCHLLGLLVNQHPNIKTIVVMEVERLLYRHNIVPRAQYYGLCFLNQLLLLPEDSSLATRLIRIYFGFFKACIKTGEVENKMMSALLTGVNRAFAFVQDDKSMLMQQIDTLYQIVHMVSFNISIQALMLLFQVQDSDENLSDRFYVSLYKKLLDPGLHNSSKQIMFLNLIYRALKRDHAEQRIKAFVKRLLQVCEYQTPGFTSGTVILISHLLKQHPNLLNCKETDLQYDDEDDDDEEHYDDMPSEDDDLSDEKNKTENSDSHTIQNSSWIHRNNMPQTGAKSKIYDPYYRNPLYAAAEYTNPWELLMLTKHYHPSVVMFSQQVVNNKTIEYSGDPLHDFTLIRFLDKFVYKNPKKSKERAHEIESQKVFGRWSHLKHKDLDVDLINKQEKNVNPEELFLYQYLLHHSDKLKKKDEDSDIESVTSEDFNMFLNKFAAKDKVEELDFAADISFQKSKKRKRGKKIDNMEIGKEEEEEDDDDVDYGDDDEFNAAFDEFQDDLEDIDNERIEFNKEDGLMETTTQSKSRKFQARNSSKKLKSDDQNKMFASAEEFSDLLEENLSNIDSTSTHALANKDKAHEKQLKWEISRDKWIHNTEWKAKKRGKTQYKKKFKSKKQTVHKKSKH